MIEVGDICLISPRHIMFPLRSCHVLGVHWHECGALATVKMTDGFIRHIPLGALIVIAPVKVEWDERELVVAAYIKRKMEMGKTDEHPPADA
jgi:hypothetical protein